MFIVSPWCTIKKVVSGWKIGPFYILIILSDMHGKNEILNGKHTPVPKDTFRHTSWYLQTKPLNMRVWHDEHSNWSERHSERRRTEEHVQSGIWYSEILIAMHTDWLKQLDMWHYKTMYKKQLYSYYVVPSSVERLTHYFENRLNLTRIEYGNNVLECRHWNGFVIFHMD